jgi:hypothetical protein
VEYAGQDQRQRFNNKAGGTEFAKANDATAGIDRNRIRTLRVFHFVRLRNAVSVEDRLTRDLGWPSPAALVHFPRAMMFYAFSVVTTPRGY